MYVGLLFKNQLDWDLSLRREEKKALSNSYAGIGPHKFLQRT